MRTFLYARVSTADQTISQQRYKLRRRASSSMRSSRARASHKLRRGDVLVVRWVDRLGRNCQELAETIRVLMERGVVVRTTINSMTFDEATRPPIQKAVRDALIGFFLAVTAQAHADATKEAQ